MPYALLIHGGADTRRPESYSDQEAANMRAALQSALRAGQTVLTNHGSALDAVEAAVCVLEDSGCFDAGRGAYLNVDGGHDLDASIMDGRTGAAGAAAHLHGVKNPVRLARRVLERTSHVLLVADGAERFAQEEGLKFVGADYFVETGATVPEVNRPTGTVGAVALDLAGNLAAATSTGGTRERRAGRVGDTPIIGAGTYADNAVGAVSGTGEGEFFLRAVLAHDIAARVEHGGISLVEAARAALSTKLTARGGKGGVIALDPTGQPVVVFNTPTMARGLVTDTDPEPVAALFDEAFPA